MNKLSDNESQSIRDTIHGLFVGDIMIASCRYALFDEILDLVNVINKESGIEVNLSSQREGRLEFIRTR